MYHRKCLANHIIHGQNRNLSWKCTYICCIYFLLFFTYAAQCNTLTVTYTVPMQGRQIATADLEEMGTCFCLALCQLQACLSEQQSRLSGDDGTQKDAENEEEGHCKDTRSSSNDRYYNTSAVLCTQPAYCLASRL